MEDSVLRLSNASLKRSASYSSCEDVARREEPDEDGFTLCPIPPIIHRVARRHSLSRLHGFNVFRDRPVHVEFDSSHGVSTFETALNLMNMTVGAGVLVLPFAVQNGGWLVLLLLAAQAFWCGASHWMLGALLAEVEGEAVRQSIPREGRGWNILAEVSMGKTGRTIVEGLVWAECFGIQLSYLILAGRCMHVLVPSIAASVHVLCIGTMVGVLLFVPVQHFSIFSFVGFIAYSMICVAIGISGFELGGWEHMENQHRTFVNPPHLLTSMGIISYVYNGHVGAPAFYQTMRDRKSWPIAVSWAMVGVLCFSVAFAAVPYAIFGESVKQSIIENVGRGMDRKILEEPLSKAANTLMAQACGAMVALKLLVTFPSFALPVVSSVEYVLDIPSGSSIQLIGRLLYAIITAVLAAAVVDHLALVMSIVGCITNNCVSCLLPSLMYLIIRWESLHYASRGGLMLLVLISVAQLVCGLYLAVTRVLS